MSEEQTTYQLASINSPNITGIKGLSFAEFTMYEDYINTLLRLTQDERFFDLVTLNHTDLKARINEYINEYDKNPNIFLAEGNPVYLNINRLILNFLSSLRTFLDHTETRLKRQYGQDSEEFKIFKVLTNNAFDESFGYRFLYKLRNYSQHCGLPSGAMNTYSTGNEKGETVNTLSLFLVRDDLLKNYDSWGEKVKEELKNQPDYFDIMPLVDEMFEQLKTINLKINSKVYLKFQLEANSLMNLLWETEKVGGIPCLLKTVGIGKGLKLTVIHFPFETISKITGVFMDVQFIGEPKL